MNTIRAIYNVILDLLFPRHVKCGLCDIELGEDFPWNLCPECTEGLSEVGEYACIGCGRHVGAFALYGRCSHCLGDGPGFSAGVSAFIYNDSAQDLIHGLKYHGKPWLAHSMAGQMAPKVRSLCRELDIQCLVPVPIHASRLSERGYNQALLLAQELSRYEGIPETLSLLERTRLTEPQNKLTRSERVKNVKGSFSVIRASAPNGMPARILLIDDVLTTGSTLNACAQALLAENVQLAAVATYASVSG